MAQRVNVRLPDDVFEKASVWSVKLGVSKSQLLGMAVQAGLDSIIRAISPVDSISPEQWAELVRAYEAKREKED